MTQNRPTDFGNVMHNFKLDKCAILEACMWSDLGKLGTPCMCLDTEINKPCSCAQPYVVPNDLHTLTKEP